MTVFPNSAKVIQVMKGDPTLWWRRVQEILTVVDSDLGFAIDELTQSKMDKMVFILINTNGIFLKYLVHYPNN